MEDDLRRVLQWGAGGHLERQLLVLRSFVKFLFQPEPLARSTAA